MKRAIAGVALVMTLGSASIAAQWPKYLAPGVPRDAVPQGNHQVEHAVEFLRLLEPAARDQFPGFAAQFAVVLLEVAAHLHERLFLTPELDGEAAA